MKIMILTLCTVFSTIAMASETTVDLALKAAITNQYPSASNVEKGWVGVLTSIGNTAMIIQAPLKKVFGEKIRDRQVMYTASFNVGSESMECLALIKTQTADTHKVLVGHCGQAGEIAMFTSGPDNGPKFLKQVSFSEDGRVLSVDSLPLSAY